MAESERTIYTIGHSNLTIERFVEALERFGIGALVDVRSMPYSRYSPQFNRETLQAGLAGRGIGYRFAGEYLGGRPSDPTCYKRGELPGPGADYLHEVDYDEVAKRDWFRRGLARLHELAEHETVAVMCSEEDPAQCHRTHLIARQLRSTVCVVNIRTKGGEIAVDPPEPVVRQMALL